MAVFPQGYSNLDARCRGGERVVLHALKRHLEDDYLVWHDVPVGPLARQPDFVVLSPRWGLLLIEVKGWKPATLGPATRDAVELRTPRGVVTEANPLRQVRGHAMELVDLMQRDPLLVHADGPFRGKLLFPYGWGIALAGIARADVVQPDDFDAVFAPHRTLLRDDLDDAAKGGPDSAAFQRKLWGMFTVHYPHTLTLPQRDRIRWHLFPEVRLHQQQRLDFVDSASGLEPLSLPSLLQVMDLHQEQVARGLGEGHRVIHGPAGSGKTMILVFRAEQLAQAARADRPVLVLCYNRSLADRLDALLRERGIDERVVVRTFHGWCEDLVRSYQLDAPRDRRDERYFEQLADATCRAVEQGRVPAGQYAALLIDEAHDFQDAWLRMSARMVDPAYNALLVLYDDAQSIYQAQRKRFTWKSVGIQASGRSTVLKINYRNTAEVLALAVRCAEQLLAPPAAPPTADGATPPLQDGGAADGLDIPTVVPHGGGRRGPLPVLIEAANAHEEAEAVAERVAQARAEGTPLRDIALLCRTKQLMGAFEPALAKRRIAMQSMRGREYRHFDWASDSVKLVTLHSAKGLEFPMVVVTGLQALPYHGNPIEDELRLLYVAMTRATERLLLSASGESPIVGTVRDALRQINRQFARHDLGALHGPAH